MSTILNPGTTPVTFTDDARIIEPGTRLYDVELDNTGHKAVARGDLIEEVGDDAPAPSDDAAPEADETTAPEADTDTDNPSTQG